MMERVSFEIRPDLRTIESSANPSTTVKITMEDGRAFEMTVDEARGTPENPLSADEIRNKYRECVRGVQSEKDAERTIGLVEDLESLDNIRGLADLLAGS